MSYGSVDSGNFILDIDFGVIEDAKQLEQVYHDRTRFQMMSHV